MFKFAINYQQDWNWSVKIIPSTYQIDKYLQVIN